MYSRGFDHYLYLEKEELQGKAQKLRESTKKYAKMLLRTVIQVVGSRGWNVLTAVEKQAYIARGSDTSYSKERNDRGQFVRKRTAAASGSDAPVDMIKTPEKSWIGKKLQLMDAFAWEVGEWLAMDQTPPESKNMLRLILTSSSIHLLPKLLRKD